MTRLVDSPQVFSLIPHLEAAPTLAFVGLVRSRCAGFASVRGGRSRRSPVVPGMTAKRSGRIVNGVRAAGQRYEPEVDAFEQFVPYVIARLREDPHLWVRESAGAWGDRRRICSSDRWPIRVAGAAIWRQT